MNILKRILAIAVIAMLLATTAAQAQSDKPAFTSKDECTEQLARYVRKIVKEANVSTTGAIIILFSDPIRSKSLLGWLDSAVYPLWKSRCMKYYR